MSSFQDLNLSFATKFLSRKNTAVLFKKAKDILRYHGEYYPLSYQQDGLGIYQDAIEWDDNGDIKGFKAKMQADMTSFANGWMKNIRDQQML